LLCSTSQRFIGSSADFFCRGAYVLAGELSLLQPGEHPRKALDAYDANFRPFCSEQQKIPMGLPDLVHPASAWKRWVLQSLLGALGRVVAAATATPWIMRRFQSAEAAPVMFKLPRYPAFEALSATTQASLP
jgi:hypothetical protein